MQGFHDQRRGASKLVRRTQVFCLQEGRSHVRRHNDDRIAEVDRAAFPIGKPAVIHDLQQDIEHIRVRLLDFVEEHHGIRTPAHLFGKLAAFFVANVARRSADEARYGVPLHVFRHVDADQGVLVVKQEFGERTRQLGLSHASRA